MAQGYKKKRNKKYIALIIEISLIIVCSITGSILDALKKQINIFIWVAVYAVLLFSLLLTLSLIRYERFREIRTGFKDTNLPIYTDNTTLMGHDIIDEQEKNRE